LKELKAQGKTVMVVHHDLETVAQYFDWVLLINMRVLAIGPTESTFTRENLQKTYSGNLTVLNHVAETILLDPNARSQFAQVRKERD